MPVAIRRPCYETKWLPAIKISESPSKTPNPGYKRIWRLYDQRGNATADLLSLEDENPRQMEFVDLYHPSEPTKHRRLEAGEISKIEPLLVEIVRDGKLVYDLPDIDAMRGVRRSDVERLDPGVRRIMHPHIYHVSLTEHLWKLKQDLVVSALELT